VNSGGGGGGDMRGAFPKRARRITGNQKMKTRKQFENNGPSLNIEKLPKYCSSIFVKHLETRHQNAC
jgi:hypothetical protein